MRVWLLKMKCSNCGHDEKEHWRFPLTGKFRKLAGPCNHGGYRHCGCEKFAGMVPAQKRKRTAANA